VRVQIEPTRVYEGDSAEYRVTVSGASQSSPPRLEGFDDFEVQSRGQQSQVTIINGRRSEAVHYVYLLTPKRTGRLKVPAPTVEADGQVVRGQEVVLEVAVSEEQDLALLAIEADKPEVYPTQPFTITLKIAVRELPAPYADRDPVAALRRRRSPALSIPWVDDESLPAGLTADQPWQRWMGQFVNPRDAGFAVNNLSTRSSVFSLFDEGPSGFLPEPRRTRRKDRTGRPAGYWEYAFARKFTPERIGEFRFGPVSLKGWFATRADVSGQFDGEEVRATAKAVTVTVRDVPTAGRPDSYTGAIGRFEWSGQLSPAQAKVGDPLTLTLRLSGRGTLDAARAPDLSRIPEVAERFKVYEATEDHRDHARQFVYSLRPLQPGAQAFPPVPFSYFDVDKGRYVTLQTPELPVTVTAAEQLSGQEIAMNPAAPKPAADIETQEAGIFANEAALSSLRDDAVRPGRWFGGLGSLAVVYVVVAFVTRRVQRLVGDPALMRRRSAVARARRRLHDARRLVESASGELQAAVTGLVADALGLTEAGLTTGDLQRYLAEQGVDSALVERVARWSAACDAARYGAGAGTMQGLEEEADVLVTALAGALKTQKSSLLLGQLLLVGLGALLTGCGAPGLEVAQQFQAAQTAFERATTPDDFLYAAGLYQAILDSGFVSGAVLYNQGNAFLRAGQRGRAIACYRQAQRYRPRDPYLDHNLRSALNAAASPSRPVVEYLLFWQNWISYGGKFRLCAAVALATFAVAVGALFATGRRWLNVLRVTGLCVTCVLAVSAGYDWYRFASVQHGVVARETVARKGNAESYEPAFAQPLPEGVEFEVREQRGDWLLVRLRGAQEGWVRRDQVVVY
jgi:tetratricopeptide (TPR) repeat protein